MTRLIVLVTGSSTGIGRLTARTLAAAGHTVYASMRDVDGHNAERAGDVRRQAEQNGVDLRVIELDVVSQDSVDAAVRTITDAHGRLDVVVHNVGHMTVGPVEAFTPEQLADLFDTNVLGAHRVNRAVLPAMRRDRRGLLVYVGSTTSRIVYPMLGPYCAVKSAADTLAQATRYDVSRYGIETVVVMPGAFTSGTQHFPAATHPADSATAQSYQKLDGVLEAVTGGLQRMSPPDASPQVVADEIAHVVGLPVGARPLTRPMVDLIGDGAAEINGVADTMQALLMQSLGVADLLRPRVGDREPEP